MCNVENKVMRAPKRRRPAVRKIGSPPAGTNLEAVANRASYVGSPEHKDVPSFAGHPRPRADASICDRSLVTHRDDITDWLRLAISRGVVSDFWDGEFPRYVWYKEAAIVYEARLVNKTAGTYKGYPLNPGEWPSDIEEYYE